MMTPMQWFSEIMQVVFGEDGGIPVFVEIALNTWFYHMDYLI